MTDTQGAALPVIATRGLAKRYRKVTALSDCISQFRRAGYRH